jgi:hypothetical protein
VEASEHVGGRVREAKGLMPWAMNVGPEFIHGGQNSPLVDLIKSAGWQTKVRARWVALRARWVTLRAR